MNHFCKYTIPVLCLLLTFVSFGQQLFNESKISKETMKAVNDLKDKNRVEGAYIGYEGSSSKQYEKFTKLIETAKPKELKELTNHPVEAVRCYAFWALWQDGSVDLLPILIQHIQDSASVSSYFGCMISFDKVGDFFIDIANDPIDSTFRKRLTPVQFQQLDSILICTPNNLYAKSVALERAKPLPYFYPVIRDLVLHEENKAALIALARYQKKEDIELVSRKLAANQSYEDHIYAYKAVSQFPAPEFLPFLEENLKQQMEKMNTNECCQLYKAIVNYGNRGVDLFQQSLAQPENNNRNRHIEYIFAAVSDSKDTIYNDLKWKLWEEEFRISPSMLNYLLARNPDRAFELVKVNLKMTDEIYSNNISYEYNRLHSTETLISEMLNLVEEKDKKYALEAVKWNIEMANVHLFPIFAEKAGEMQEEWLIEPLFKRLETESNPHIYLKAAAALIEYENPKINQRILDTRKINLALTEGWGGEAFNRLLKNKGLL